MNQLTNQIDSEIRLKDLAEENELLLLQLHQVQEELEHYYLKNQELEKGHLSDARSVAVAPSGDWTDEEMPTILAEKYRLQALVEVQQKMFRLEAENALNVRLGNILINAVDTPSSLASLPTKLLRIWRQSRSTTLPDSLGGKDFSKVVTAFREGGFAAVEKLLTDHSISTVMQANAYTALARAIMKSSRADAAQAARRAHALDPKLYRLKWLAFRLHEAGEVAEAEAMLDILPADITFSESEQRQTSQLRYEAKRAREQAARQERRFDQRRLANEQQMKALAQARDQQTRLAEERGRELDGLKQAKAQLEQEKQGLLSQGEAQTRLAEERGRELDGLKQAKAQLEQEKQGLLSQGEAQTRLAEERGRELDGLKQAKAQLEQDKQGLLSQNEAQTRLAADRLKQLNELQQKLQSFQASETELKIRQQMTREEMARTEAQLDLIKELLLREPGL